MTPHPQIKLGRGVSLVRSFSNPLGRLGIVLWHSFSFGIHQSEVELCQGMILLGRLAIPLGCLSKILQPSFGSAVFQSQGELRLGVSLVRPVSRRS